MATEFEVQIVSRESIKPSSPTPNHLKNFKLSILDQITPQVMQPSLVLFYQANGETDRHQISQRLKTSLSNTLTKFYPLAGRLRENQYVDCNDDGAEYVEAQVKNCMLTDILHQPDLTQLRKLYPVKPESREAEHGCLLVVQSSFFECGGMAIGVNFSHKLVDACSMCSFFRCWAAMAVGSSEEVIPEYNAATVFPPVNPPTPGMEINTSSNCVIVTRRFVFCSPNIVLLKARAASANVQQPTRVEAVTALLWKSYMNTLRSPKLSILVQAMNLRTRVHPPLPGNSFGNIIGTFFAHTNARVSEIVLQDLVWKMRQSKQEFSKNGVQTILEKKSFMTFTMPDNMAETDDIDVILCSSWCRYPLYEFDFGWEMPTWLTIPNTALKNVIELLDARDGEGIEALVTLSEEDMALFERDHDLLAFAASNPSIFNS